MKKILIAGSQSFVGKNFFNPLFKNNKFELIPLDRTMVDLTDKDQLKQFVIEKKPDFIVHCAVSLKDAVNNLKMYYTLESVCSLVNKVIMIGSGCEYAHQRYIPEMKEEYFNPQISPHNNDAYHNSKFTISRLHENSPFRNIYNFRVFGLYGIHEDYTRRLISNNVYQYILDGTMSYNKDISFDYLYIKDLIDAIYYFVSSSQRPKHKTYNICKGKGEKFSYILEQIMEGLDGNQNNIKCNNEEKTEYEYSGCCKRFELEYSYKIAKTLFKETSLPLKEWIVSDITNKDKL